ncbi:hypothetical protein KVV02_002069 [Mortierella alpina]|uniref:Uncharacterized protein n=1 Tax=Mortierella alpina TaxID=64518 RepID=A0A9P8A9B8_MORAP|nr:hypothetical protein KVV02_002069 [Mortierella alpina]
MATAPLQPASAPSPSPPMHSHACDSESEANGPPHPHPKRARCTSPDRDPQPAQIPGDSGLAPQTQLEETREKSSPKPRSNVHDDAHDAQDKEAEAEAEADEDEDEMVLSEVHIHPDNGRVDGRWLTSVFLLSHTNQDQHQDTSSVGGSDEDESQMPDTWDHALEIQHAMGTTLREVGSQVWMGCFLLVDYIMEMKDQLNEAVVLELGAGTGLASIALGLMTDVSTVYCTDFDTDILSNCAANIIHNGQEEVQMRKEPESTPLETRIKAKRLNWLMKDPMQSLEDQTDRFDWLDTEAEEWRTKGTFIFAADVVYDDSLTDALVACLERLLCEPLPEDHPRKTEGRVAILTMEKRYNFSLDELDVVAQAHDYFVKRMGRSLLLEAQRVDYSSLGRYCNYDRSKDLVSGNEVIPRHSPPPHPFKPTMSWAQTTIRLPAKPRGCHLVTGEIEKQLPELKQFSVGMANVFRLTVALTCHILVQHTSASLTLNENADPDVRVDMEMALNEIAPESMPFTHTDEGPDDMTGHLKSTLVGVSLNIPITNGRFNLGTWQGIWLCEHRNHASGRRIVVTLQGEKRK